MKTKTTKFHGFQVSKFSGELSLYEFEVDDLLRAGLIKITDIGGENLYFEALDDNGKWQKCFTKMR